MSVMMSDAGSRAVSTSALIAIQAFQISVMSFVQSSPHQDLCNLPTSVVSKSLELECGTISCIGIHVCPSYVWRLKKHRQTCGLCPASSTIPHPQLSCRGGDLHYDCRHKQFVQHGLLISDHSHNVVFDLRSIFTRQQDISTCFHYF